MTFESIIDELEDFVMQREQSRLSRSELQTWQRITRDPPVEGDDADTDDFDEGLDEDE